MTSLIDGVTHSPDRIRFEVLDLLTPVLSHILLDFLEPEISCPRVLDCEKGSFLPLLQSLAFILV